MEYKTKQQLERWKNKYLTLVDEIDKKEDEWTSLNKILKRALVRVSLAAAGIDDRLDRQLAKLRKSLQKDTDIASLKRQVDVITDQVLELDEHKSTLSDLLTTSAEQLIPVLETADLPARIKKKLRQSARHLIGHPPAVHEFLDEYAKSLEAFLVQTSAEVSSNNASSESIRNLPGTTKETAGFFSRWKKPALTFKSETKQEASSLPSQHSATDTAPETEAPSDLSSHLLLTFKDPLFNLLDNLPLGSDLANHAEDIRETIDSCIHLNTLPDSLKDIASLVATSGDKDQEQFDRFLNQISRQFLQVNQFLKQFSSDYGSDINSSDALNTHIRGNIEQVQSTITQAQSLSQLQQEIGHQFSSILDYLDQFQAGEKRRNETFCQEIKILNSQLTETEQTTEQLKGQLQEQKLRNLLDPLTRIPNRSAYETKMLFERRRWGKFGGNLSLLIADLDGFKIINDTFGHLAGDKVLRTAAKTLKINIRSSDFIARLGEDEFAIILPDTKLDKAQQLAKKLHNDIANCPFFFREQNVVINISIGAAEFSNNDSSETVFERADKDLYQIKQGKNKA